MIETLLVAGVSLTAGWVWSRVFTRKVKPIVRYASPQEDAEALKEVDRMLGIDTVPSYKTTPIIKWCGSDYRTCPKCTLKLSFVGIKCCDCETLPYTHFHLSCNGTDRSRPPNNVGCHIKYLMLAADTPTDLDIKKLIAIDLPKKKKVKND